MMDRSLDPSPTKDQRFDPNRPIVGDEALGEVLDMNVRTTCRLRSCRAFLASSPAYIESCWTTCADEILNFPEGQTCDVVNHYCADPGEPCIGLDDGFHSRRYRRRLFRENQCTMPSLRRHRDRLGEELWGNSLGDLYTPVPRDLWHYDGSG